MNNYTSPISKEVMGRLNKLVSWWDHLQARQAAKKYKLDFEIKCVFDHQLKGYGYPKSGDICSIPMESGRTGLYKAEVTECMVGGTGQKNWKFTFQGYSG